MNNQNILIKSEPAIVTISLNTPHNMNALNESLLTELHQALIYAKNQEGVKVVIINSTSNAFSSGGDLLAMSQGLASSAADQQFQAVLRLLTEITLEIKKMSQIVIAAISGPAAGAGFNLALAADFLIAAETATFSQAFVKVGLIPDAGGLYLLSKAIGSTRAMNLALTGTTLSAKEAYSLGIISQLTSKETLALEVDNLAKKLSRGPAVAFHEMKALIYETTFHDFESYLGKEATAQLRCSHTSDFKEGVTAFLEKRLPQFK